MHASIASPFTTGAQAPAGSVMMWIAALLLSVVAGAAALFWIRRRLLGEDPADRSTGLTLQDLREMHQRGTLTDEEFAAAKRAVLGASADGSTPSRNPITGTERGRPPR
ncbi:MAG: SHOCT domain-containing protein [Phycisphaerae bacterium]|nr:SHOCT domain-containing protein [Phycisphaerae bacterium]